MSACGTRHWLPMTLLLLAGASCGPCDRPEPDPSASPPARPPPKQECGAAKPGDRFIFALPLGLRDVREVQVVRGDATEVKRTSLRADGSIISEEVVEETRASVFGTHGRRHHGRERIIAAGCPFDCDVYVEQDDSREPAIAGRWWVSDRYPYIIRASINGVIVQDLIGIQRARR